jgi:hypothetical protein
MSDKKLKVERVQTGVRLEKRMVKVLKALAEYLDITMGDLLEGIILHALEGKATTFDAETLARIQQIKDIYGMDYGLEFAHKLTEADNED